MLKSQVIQKPRDPPGQSDTSKILEDLPKNKLSVLFGFIISIFQDKHSSLFDYKSLVRESDEAATIIFTYNIKKHKKNMESFLNQPYGFMLLVTIATNLLIFLSVEVNEKFYMRLYYDRS